ncbi:MAG: DUF473 domain-containing protein [Candidatus Methanoperedens sp.]|nr:DUF473 domain-containing protein [Candidatus Methanoperedens sp.]MCE8427889.1 DUF473 domain-containing protein [Candidatus Methanoperedens sp.]
MHYILLSGISQQVIRDLEHNKIKTIEIGSPHNFLSALEANVEDIIFLTSISQEDVRPGTTGIITVIRGKQISMHRVVQKTEEYYEEAEVQRARLQLEMRGHARVRSVQCCELGEATSVDADKVQFFEGR